MLYFKLVMVEWGFVLDWVVELVFEEVFFKLRYE